MYDDFFFRPKLHFLRGWVVFLVHFYTLITDDFAFKINRGFTIIELKKISFVKISMKLLYSPSREKERENILIFVFRAFFGAGNCRFGEICVLL